MLHYLSVGPESRAWPHFASGIMPCAESRHGRGNNSIIPSPRSPPRGKYEQAGLREGRAIPEILLRSSFEQ